MAADPLDPQFWTQEAEELYDILFPLIRASTVAAALSAYNELAGTVQLGISWEVINTAAIRWAEKYTAEVVAQVSKTSMAAFLDAFEPWLQSGAPLPDLINTLIPFYGEVRAEMVAVTEVTRAFAQGNLAFWTATGMVTGYNFRTAQDDLVCPLCDNISGAASRNPHRLDDYDDLPPRHVRCRCAITPYMGGF